MNKADEIINEAISEINNQFDDVNIENRPDFLLLDSDGTIDSVALVNLFITIETLIEEKTGKEISVVKEDSFESELTPFKSVGSLTDYIKSLLNE
jgi:acyl carrier protein